MPQVEDRFLSIEKAHKRRDTAQAETAVSHTHRHHRRIYSLFGFAYIRRTDVFIALRTPFAQIVSENESIRLINKYMRIPPPAGNRRNIRARDIVGYIRLFL